jgi:hypothetical protein
MKGYIPGLRSMALLEVTVEQILELIQQIPLDSKRFIFDVLRQSLATQSSSRWQYLVSRPHPWRKQFYVKGSKLLASTIWHDMKANEMTVEQASDNWALPISVIQEAVSYCDSHQDLIKLEADEEKYRLAMQEIIVEPQTAA